METFVLASGSPRRRELLERLQVKFRVQEAGIVESFVEGAAPDRVVMELSWRKADAVAKNIGDRAVVLGADTVVAVENKILGKPSNGEEALSMLKALRGRIHHVYTGITLCFPVNTTYIQAYERTEVSMAMVPDELLEWYVATGEPMDKAGAYGIQGKGALLVDRIQGDYWNVVGLPLYKLEQTLQSTGRSLRWYMGA
ncbi:Maf family nucleotide pyrophosphatase [Bianquea renquensis]|uniref:dTTP/UTP pyrophosphatase n=1 Tax=Bianquea renquensis TaxID=2763661 RepID=A0A926DSI9_9FIRM|nr:septum formation inhibitor Maf [Bianquea renquensis]